MAQQSVNKYSHGRYPVAVTYSANLYTAPTDGQGKSRPFQINSQVGGVIRVLLFEASAYVDTYFNAGDNPALVIGISDQGALSANLVALYPGPPPTTTINTTY